MLDEKNSPIPGWKKGGLIILISSEIGLTPFLAEAIAQTVDIFSRIIFQTPAAYIIKISIGYGLAVPYVISAMLSVGDINKSLRRLMSASGPENYELSRCFKLTQQFLIGSAFIIGSAAAAVGVLNQWGKTPVFYGLAIFTLTGQVVVVLLQANKRILSSANALRNFFRNQQRCTLFLFAFKKNMRLVTVNTAFNTMYWGVFYFYIGANIGKMFDLSTLATVILGSIFTSLGSYMSFCTQGIDEIQSCYKKTTNPENPEETSQFKDPTCASLTLTTLSFLCRSLATVSFAYSMINGRLESEGEFVAVVGIASMLMLIPGASSAVQYVKYIHNQVGEAISGIKSYLSCSRLAFWRKAEEIYDNNITNPLLHNSEPRPSGSVHHNLVNAP